MAEMSSLSEVLFVGLGEALVVFNPIDDLIQPEIMLRGF